VVEESSFDLLRAPLIGRILRWRHARTLFQAPLVLLGLLMILHGFFGPSIAPKNLATTLTWVHFRGALVLVLLVAGNFFCFACPFVFVRDIARKFFRPVRNFPRVLRNKWLSVSMLVAGLFVYELFDLWSSPWWTALLISSYFLVALIVDGFFKHASFCKFVCPIGQFNFLASTISPLEVKVRDQAVCTGCKTKDCIKGHRDPVSPLVVIQRGCELALFQPRKTGNIDCTFCLDCVQACPHDNVGILARVPASELTVDPMRSGVGILSKRSDLSALSLVFVFGALLNAFGMVSPVYAVESWLARTLNVNHEAPVLGVLFVIALVIEPIVLLLVPVWLTRRSVAVPGSPISLLVRYSYALVPLGFGIWLAHYSFHFLTGFLTVVPVLQSAAVDVGLNVLGPPAWGLTGLAVPPVHAIEFGFIGLGLLGSLLVSYRLAEQDAPAKPIRVFLPWAGVATLICVTALWLMSQPMEMRGTILGG
jgi:4Fe-4S binding domain